MMEIQTEKRKGVLIVSVPHEELDAANAPDFKAAMSPVLEGQKKVILDIAALEFVDSSGLGAFLSCLKTVKSVEGRIAFANVSRNVRNVFELVHFYKLFDYYDSLDEALRKMK